MASVDLALGRMHSKWAMPSIAIHRGESYPFKLRCSFAASPAAGSDLLSIGDELDVELPAEVLQFWKKHQSASLFEDVEFGQWGLEILSPSEAIAASKLHREERSNDAVHGDFILGRFYGDSELLLVRCDPNSGDYSTLLIVLPLDERNEWPLVASDFADFLEHYERAEGDKFWDDIREIT